MTYDHERGRDDLLAFGEEQPTNFWQADPHLQRSVRHWAGAEAAGAWEAILDRYGAECAGPIDALVRENDRIGNHPRLDRFGPFGDRIEAVDFHPTYHAIGRALYGSGTMKVLGEKGRFLQSQALGYLAAQLGEAGHNCPLACTAGVIKVLVHVADPSLRARYLPRLLSTDYETLAHGAQFLTEVQGGSDVGANSIRAVPGDAEGEWRIHGEKWFCSNATADLILMTARPDGAPEGTRGLGLFLVPRRLPDGSLNRYFVRRLKEKLGTRTMASGEIDFEGALAYSVGPVEDGFKTMMTYVINVSRILNAVGTSGIARRACHVGAAYARRRKAFGPPILAYPMVQESLADMLSETAAMTSGTFQLLHEMDRWERGESSETDDAFRRMAVNLNKMKSAQSSHEVVVTAIELLGGNGAIETFSVLPRLLRDNVVFENWEGTHNVLLMQVLRDARRLKLHEGFFERLSAMTADHPRLSAAVSAGRAEMDEVLAEDDATASLRMRPLGAKLAWIQWGAAMVAEGTEDAVVDHFLDRRLGPDAPRNAAYLQRIAAVSGAG